MIDDKIDVDVYPNKKGWNVVVSYWYYNRNSAASSIFPETGTYSKGIFALSYP